MQRVWVWIVTLCVLVFGAAACSEDYSASRATARVRVSAPVGPAAIAPLGVPVDNGGLSAIVSAELTVFRGGVRIYFDGAGVEVEAAASVPIELIGGTGSVDLTLYYGTYDFVVVARDAALPTPNDLASGSLLGVLVNGDASIYVPLVSLIGTAELGAPLVVLPNEVFDVFLTVRPPGRSDLRVPTSDYTVGYVVTGSTAIGTSALGIRVTAVCDDITIAADVTRAGEASPSTQATTVVSVDFLCPTSTIPVSIDLIPPFVNITAPATGSIVAIDTPVELSGTTNDAQTGVASVDVYDGVALLGTAVITPGDPPTWTLTFTPDTARTYEITAIATDGAGIQSQATIELVVEE